MDLDVTIQKLEGKAATLCDAIQHGYLAFGRTAYLNGHSHSATIEAHGHLDMLTANLARVRDAIAEVRALQTRG